MSTLLLDKPGPRSPERSHVRYSKGLFCDGLGAESLEEIAIICGLSQAMGMPANVNDMAVAVP